MPAATRPAEAPVRKPYVTKAFGGFRESDPPYYVRTLSKTGLPGTESLDWLDLGFEQRTRWEFRDDDYRRPILEDDNQFLMRTRGYLGFHDIIDPLRFGFEFQDSRQFNSQFPETIQDVDEYDMMQLFSELYFKDAFGRNEPLRFRVGRMSFDLVDRRQIARPRWRNTTNAYDGFLAGIGNDSSDWSLQILAVQPVERFLRRFDHGDDESWLYGVWGAWRGWSDVISIEPYYFILDQDRVSHDMPDREIHTLGVHAFSMIPGTGFDWDFDTMFQCGRSGDERHRASAHFAELGYTFEHAWKPRLSYAQVYATGDRSPDDHVSERFDRLFNSGHSYTMHDYFILQNTIMSRLRFEFQPHRQVRFDAAYGGYWLARDGDAWVAANRQDPTGHSGDFVGHDMEARIRIQLEPRIDLELGYVHFMPGPFARNTGPADDSDFFYISTTVRLFE